MYIMSVFIYSIYIKGEGLQSNSSEVLALKSLLKHNNIRDASKTDRLT